MVVVRVRDYAINFIAAQSFGIESKVWSMGICLNEKYTKHEIRRGAYEYCRSYII